MYGEEFDLHPSLVLIFIMKQRKKNLWFLLHWSSLFLFFRTIVLLFKERLLFFFKVTQKGRNYYSQTPRFLWNSLKNRKLLISWKRKKNEVVEKTIRNYAYRHQDSRKSKMGENVRATKRERSYREEWKLKIIETGKGKWKRKTRRWRKFHKFQICPIFISNLRIHEIRLVLRPWYSWLAAILSWKRRYFISCCFYNRSINRKAWNIISDMTVEDKNRIKYESLSKYLPSKRINIVVNSWVSQKIRLKSWAKTG